MPWYQVIWTDEFIEHLAEHDITPDDFEYVIMNPVEQIQSRSSGRRAVYGFTPDGRWVFASYDIEDEFTVYPATCFEPDPE